MGHFRRPRLFAPAGGRWPGGDAAAAGHLGRSPLRRARRRANDVARFAPDGALSLFPLSETGAARCAPLLRVGAAVSDEMYNAVVIGGGAAGLITAAATAGLGGRVALIERRLMG